MKRDKVLLIADKILDKLSKRKDLHINDLFCFWDILRDCYGEESCIEEHRRIAGEILCEINRDIKGDMKWIKKN